MDRFASFRVFILVRTFLFIYSVMFDFSFEAATDPYMRFIHLKGASISPHLHFENFTFELIFARNLTNNPLNRTHSSFLSPNGRKSGRTFSQGHFEVEGGHFFLDTVWILVFRLEKNNCLLIEWFSKILTRIVSFSQFWLLSNQNSAQRF